MKATRSAGFLSICLSIAASASCNREARRFSEGPVAAETAHDLTIGDLPLRKPDRSTAPFKELENAYAIAEGKRLYDGFNCSGCHFHGGGGIGPPLMDHRWIYGSEPANVFASIVEGRPNGMPSFRGTLRSQQAWQLVAYVRSMSGDAPKAAAPGRNDDMQVRLQEQSMPTPAPVNVGSPP